MKVLLSTPPSTKPLQTIPDIGLGFLATALRKSGHEVMLVQPERLGGGIAELESKIRTFEPRIVGFKVFSKDIRNVRDTLGKLKGLNGEITTVIGGPHPSCAKPGELMEYFGHADYAFAGEADRALPLLIERLDGPREGLADIPGLIYRDAGGFRSNPPDYIAELDELGSPAWDLFDPALFMNRWMFWLKGRPAAPISTGRGCPFKCTFCAQQVVSGKRVRRRSAEAVFDEVAHLVDRYSIRYFDFIDDNFITSKEYVKNFCGLILDRKLDIRWSCGGVHLKTITPEIVRLMESAGCRAMAVGIESGNDEILKHMRKGISTAEIENSLKVIKENSKIKVMGQFILGYPLDTLETVRQTVDFACRLPLDLATFYTFIPLPGSEIFGYLLERGEIKGVDWDAISISRSPYSPPGLPLSKLLMQFKLAYLRFYARPRVIAGMLREVSSPEQGSAYWTRLKDKFLR